MLRYLLREEEHLRESGMLYECGCGHLGMLEDCDPKSTAKAAEELFRVKVEYPELRFHLLKTGLKEEWRHSKQELKVFAGNAAGSFWGSRPSGSRFVFHRTRLDFVSIFQDFQDWPSKI